MKNNQIVSIFKSGEKAVSCDVEASLMADIIGDKGYSVSDDDTVKSTVQGNTTTI